MGLTWSTVQFHLQNPVSGFLLVSVGRGLVGIPLTVVRIHGGGVCQAPLHSQSAEAHCLSVSACGVLGPRWRRWGHPL